MQIETTNLTPLEFWYAHLGRYLAPESKYQTFAEQRCLRCGSTQRVTLINKDPICLSCLSFSLNYPMATKQKEMRLGGKETLCIASPHGSVLIADVRLPTHHHLKVIPTGTVSINRYVAEYMLAAKPPYLITVLSKADSRDTLRVTTSTDVAYLCGHTPKTINLRQVRPAKAGIEGYPPADWKRAAMLEQKWSHRDIEDNLVSLRIRAQLETLYKNRPGLELAVRALPLFGSNEYELLSWTTIQYKPFAPAGATHAAA